ncbi:DUF1761 domain-containing protein [Methylobacterium sp. BTF04]|uniref:DUF1761 domain-containing protein n=1 Tax=Methylobacterium sp. BTF04 TaxID=2708300 RepID=UPI0013D0E47F|nr:DUF1761 domain-containing protein [Methylobacterium sp. BTF04]NEU13232.1 DUF1761 domain-containing protein [Methylobacterium sp. BTF04]
MIDALSHVNWLAVGVASVAHFLLGAAWFVGLVGKYYPVVLGIADRPQKSSGPLSLAGPFACTAVTIATSAVLLRALGITTYGDALLLGALVGIGYLVPMTLNIAINPLFPRPFAYTALNAPFFVTGSLMSCAILVALS